ncbi:hypothetical protein [Agrobacterium larrymoorei]|uniref:Uncharacterized protein n=2 Tax=Agrobacterium TaxID=357 RepID=A0A2Z2PNL5_AGRTU|nr:hypothetical protein [Agrobacterium larrymoorei]ASK44704.1 hypothetical protein [Agrobacterium tumefaciens]WHA44278.1 hypothetical protein CFBP5477_023320 [Agrobacterium larrymoorei]
MIDLPNTNTPDCTPGFPGVSFGLSCEGCLRDRGRVAGSGIFLPKELPPPLVPIGGGFVFTPAKFRENSHVCTLGN